MQRKPHYPCHVCHLTATEYAAFASTEKKKCNMSAMRYCLYSRSPHQTKHPGLKTFLFGVRLNENFSRLQYVFPCPIRKKKGKKKYKTLHV